MSSIKDVARAADVSITTVSLVLNGKGNISPETRQRVLQVVDEMGYVRSIQARNLRDNQSRVVGYAWDAQRSEFNPVLDNFLYELVRLTEAEGRHLLLYTTETEGTATTYRQLVESKRVDGFILSHTNQGDERFGLLHEMNVPFVSFGRSASEWDDITYWVDTDGQAGMFAVTNHLIEQGHERIAIIAWPMGSVSGDGRYAGYLDAMRASNLEIMSEWVVRAENYIANGYQAAQELMGSAKPPTAVVTVSDVLALGAMRYFSEQGLRIAVTGFDNTPIAEFMYPPLTSVRQPIEKVAALLVDMLLAQLDGVPVAVKKHLLEPELIIRASSTLEY